VPSLLDAGVALSKLSYVCSHDDYTRQAHAQPGAPSPGVQRGYISSVAACKAADIQPRRTPRRQTTWLQLAPRARRTTDGAQTTSFTAPATKARSQRPRQGAAGRV